MPRLVVLSRTLGVKTLPWPFIGVCALLAWSCQADKPETFTTVGVQAGAVVSEHPLATAVGLEILERGGNAADAAVGTALTLAVVYPQAGNLGGGGFAIVAMEGQPPEALDFREVAPRKTNPALYLDEEGDFVPKRSLEGPLAVGVPGSPAGLFELHRKYGSGLLTWEQLVEPALLLARDGFDVDPWLARDLTRESTRARMNGAAREIFYPRGASLAAGDRLVQSDLARTLSALAENGPDGFYRGAVADALLRAIETEQIPGAGLAGEGALDRKDLERYEPKWRKPLIGSFQGAELIAMPPPSSGGLVILQTLAMLEGLPLQAEVQIGRTDDLRGALTERMAHWWIEALRRSFADRAEHMGDADYHDVPMQQLLSPEWTLERRASISNRADLNVAPWVAAPPVESKETTHLSVVDRDGSAVSMTTTLNGSFGSGILVRGAGFLLNNELDDFAIQAGVPNQFGLIGSQANAIEGGKRPLSSMAPMIVRDGRGRLMMVLGSPGGPRIITSVIQVVLRVLLLEQGLPAAIRAVRLHQQWRPEETFLEGQQGGGWDPALVRGLRGRGHPVEVQERRFGSVQGILIAPDGWPTASSDPRRGGAAGVEGRGVQAPALPPK